MYYTYFHTYQQTQIQTNCVRFGEGCRRFVHRSYIEALVLEGLRENSIGSNWNKTPTMYVALLMMQYMHSIWWCNLYTWIEIVSCKCRFQY